MWLMLVLKIPIGMLLWLVWWAIKQTPEEAEQPPVEGDGGSQVPHPPGPLPRRPRRGPHGDPVPAAPARVRVAQVRSRTPER